MIRSGGPGTRRGGVFEIQPLHGRFLMPFELRRRRPSSRPISACCNAGTLTFFPRREQTDAGQTGKLPRRLPKKSDHSALHAHHHGTSEVLLLLLPKTTHDRLNLQTHNPSFFLPMPLPLAGQGMSCRALPNTRVPPPQLARGNVPSSSPSPPSSQGRGSCEAVNLPRAPHPHPSYRIVACRSGIMHRRGVQISP